MSPEQARGLRTVDSRSDLWAVGVIAYRCVVGRLPFEGEAVGDLLVKICTAPLPVPSQQGSGVPPGFDAWFARALARNPEDRFGSASELSEALCAAVGLAGRGEMPSSAFQDISTVAGAMRGPVSPDQAPTAADKSPYQPGDHTPQAGLTAAPLTQTASSAVVRTPSVGVLVGVAAIGLLVVGIGAAALLKLVVEGGEELPAAAEHQQQTVESPEGQSEQRVAPAAVAPSAAVPSVEPARGAADAATAQSSAPAVARKPIPAKAQRSVRPPRRAAVTRARLAPRSRSAARPARPAAPKPARAKPAARSVPDVGY